MDKQKIKGLAYKWGYSLRKEEPSSGLLIFIRVGVQVNVYTTKMTVGTSMDHPKKGKTQLFRRHVDLATLEKIFKNPRLHTGAGYYER